MLDLINIVFVTSPVWILALIALYIHDATTYDENGWEIKKDRRF